MSRKADAAIILAFLDSYDKVENVDLKTCNMQDMGLQRPWHYQNCLQKHRPIGRL
jgi:hypothetical protein